jgi:hypothetical protein
MKKCPKKLFAPSRPRRLSENEIFFSKIKEGENYNHRNTLEYFEDYNLSLTQRLGKIAILGQPPREECGIFAVYGHEEAAKLAYFAGKRRYRHF